MSALSALTGHLGWYGAAVAALLTFKLLLSIPKRRQRPVLWPDKPRLTVAAIITVYNEDPDTLRGCLDSLFAQSRPPDAITIIDDASSDRRAAEVAHLYAGLFHLVGTDYAVVEFARNKGKRHGLAAGFERSPNVDVYMCIDSDTVLVPEATEEALRPFASRRVHCVTGLVLALNRGTNLLTRLIDMRYVNAFLGERAGYSRFGSVLCACGSLALYRGWVVRRYVGDFLNQTWLGVPATAGDDRRLTSYCLREGRAVLQPTAIARTAVPERLTHYLRQQTRWTKSFIREGLLMLATSPSRVCWWFNLLELGTWLAFTGALLVAVAGVALHPEFASLFLSYAIYVSAASWLRSLHYLRRATKVPTTDRWLTFALAPTYALMNLTLLIPLRIYALATMRDSSWGTRGQVEVAKTTAPRSQDSFHSSRSPEAPWHRSPQSA